MKKILSVILATLLCSGLTFADSDSKTKSTKSKICDAAMAKCKATLAINCAFNSPKPPECNDTNAYCAIQTKCPSS